MKESVSELRKMLQEPRRAFDTWYGWNVMRRGSIFISIYAINKGWHPSRVTTLSLFIGVIGAFFFLVGWVGLGILCINLWYLVDHSDGEVARYTNQTSASGYYYDTILNFIVQPICYIGLGYSLQLGGHPGMLGYGVMAAFGSLLLMIVPVCEDAVILSSVRKSGFSAKGKKAESTINKEDAFSLKKKLFSLWHTAMTFPNSLLTLSALYILAVFTAFEVKPLLSLYLIVYAFSIHIIWTTQLFFKIYNRKTDQDPVIEFPKEGI